MQDILIRLKNSSTNESSHELQCRCMDAATEIHDLRRVIEANADGHKECLEENRLLRTLLRDALSNLDHRDLNIQGNDLADRIEAALTPNGQGQRGDDGLIVGDSAAPDGSAAPEPSSGD